MSTARAVAHGVSCHKEPHISDGYLHGPDDDRPYDVDGITYCGRCHHCLDQLPDEQKIANGQFTAEIHDAWPDISRRLALLEETVRRAHDCISGEFDHAAEDVSCLSLKAMKHELHAVIVTRVPSTEDQSNG